MTSWFDGWVYEIVATWSPLRRWAFTCFLIMGIFAVWWWLGLHNVYQSFHRTKNEVALLEKANQELNALLQKHRLGEDANQNLPHTSLSISEMLLECALEADLGLEQSTTPEHTPEDPSNMVECHVHGGFENIIAFLTHIQAHNILLLKCTLTRMSNKVIKGNFLFSDCAAQDESLQDVSHS